MKKPMLNAIQKARMSMAMKSKNPKMNPGFDSLPKDVQAKIMNKRKPKLSKKSVKRVIKKGTDMYVDAMTLGMGGQKLKNKKNRALGLGVTIKESFADRDKKKYPNTAEGRKRFEKDAKAYLKKKKKPKMAMKKKAKMGMKKAKASQTAGAIMKRERLML